MSVERSDNCAKNKQNVFAKSQNDLFARGTASEILDAKVNPAIILKSNTIAKRGCIGICLLTGNDTSFYGSHSRTKNVVTKNSRKAKITGIVLEKECVSSDPKQKNVKTAGY